MEIKYNLLFFVDKEGTIEKGYKPDGKLRLRIRWESGKVDFNLGYRVDLSKWSTDTQRCKTGTTHGKKKIPATEINHEIQRLEKIVSDVIKAYEVEEYVPTVDEFRDVFNRTSGKVKIPDTPPTPLQEHECSVFYQKLLEFTASESTKRNWVEGTGKRFKALTTHLKDFDENLTFELLNENKLVAFMDHLQGKGMRNSTAAKQLALLKWFLRWALKSGYTSNNAFTLFRPKLKSIAKKVIFLTWEELTKLREYQIPESKKYLDRVRDVFLFQCYTSLRYSDVYNLRRGDIKSDHIEIITVKTNDSLVIELNDYSREILAKYRDIHFAEDKALPVITNQKMNFYLKELAELAGIDEPVRESYYKGGERIDETTPKHALIGTHCARRTFISNSLAMGISPQTVMKWTGHADYKAMKPYIDIADTDRKTAMEAWNKKEDSDTEKLLESLKNLPKEKLAKILEVLNS